MPERIRKHKLSSLAFESLCLKATSAPHQTAPNETLEDVYWEKICLLVHRYLSVPFSYQDIEGVSRKHLFQTHLQQLLASRRTEEFDILAIAGKQIQNAIEQTCVVHRTRMKEESVPLAYGRPIPDEELWEARARLFPNAKRYLLGGCIAGSLGSERETLVCDQCRTAEREWRKTRSRFA